MAALVAIALATAVARADERSFDALAGQELRETPSVGQSRHAVRGDPGLAIEAFHHHDLPVIRKLNMRPVDVAAVKQRRDALAKAGFPIVEIVEVGTLRGAAAALVRRYPDAGYDPLGPGDPTAFLGNVDPVVTARDLDRIEGVLERLRRSGADVEFGHLLVTKQGHVLVDGGHVYQTDGLPLPRSANDHERLEIESVRRGLRFVEGLVSSGIAADVPQARGLALDIFRNQNTVGVAEDLKDPRIVTVQRLLGEMYDGEAGKAIAGRLPRQEYEDAISRALVRNVPRNLDTTRTKGAAAVIGGALGDRKRASH